MTRKDVAISLAFAAAWSVLTIWWSDDRSLAYIIILSIVGLAVGFGWTWAMKRFGYIK